MSLREDGIFRIWSGASSGVGEICQKCISEKTSF